MDRNSEVPLHEDGQSLTLSIWVDSMTEIIDNNTGLLRDLAEFNKEVLVRSTDSPQIQQWLDERAREANHD